MTLREGQRRVANLLDLSQWKLTPYQILVLGFASLIFFGAIVLMLPFASRTGEPISFLDALFTATSAVCVTGLTVLETGTHFSVWGQLVLLFLIQVGALGIMTLSTLFALLIGKRIRLKERLLMQESLNQLTVSGVVRLTIYIVKTTLIIEMIGGTLLALVWFQDLGWKGVYFGYWHAISAFCNAGFDLFGTVSGPFTSLTAFADHVIVNCVVMVMIVLGGIGFPVLYDAWSSRTFDEFSLHSKIVLVTSATLVFSGAILIYLMETNNPATFGELPYHSKFLASLFQSVTARTAGYNTVDVGKMYDGTLLLMIILMFIGASPSSTGGGIKTTTAAVLFIAIGALARGRTEAECFERRIPKEYIYKAFSVLLLSFALILAVTLALTITEQTSFIKILFEVVSAFGTVGLSTGITPGLSPMGKIWLIMTMFAGRVGPITLALAIAMRSRKTQIQYPEGKILIG